MADDLLRLLRNVNEDFKQSGWSFSVDYVDEVVRGKCIGFLGMIHLHFRWYIGNVFLA